MKGIFGDSKEKINLKGLLFATFMLLSGHSAWAQTVISSLSDITDANGSYIITDDISASGYTSIATFSGTLTAQAKDDGTFPTISGLSVPLFTTASGAIISNIMLSDVSVSASGNAGAIAANANGATRIYNCGILSGTVGGSAYTGGLVGFLDGEARVINCFSFADITSGSYVGGIVGYNNVSTTSGNLKTMVMNCMFYGDITGGTNKAPIYNGTSISNAGNTGVGNYNYFRIEAPYVQPTGITYNCALGAEDRFLQRFEFYRHLLNGHRELAAWWATGSYANKDLMAKWVMEPSQIGSATPYPILKAPGKYPSVVNIDAENAVTTTERNKGGLLSTLTVAIRMGSGAVFGPPTGAAITTSQLTLNITDKDFDHFNFNYYKVQLPYYNDVGTKNYNGNRVVTGWKIVSITGGTPGSFTTGDDATADANGNITNAPYNFADRNCTNKDLYSVSGRVFNQGAYWDVPEGVTSITIEPYWAQAAYVADEYADVVYSGDMKTKYNVNNVGGGQKYTNNTLYNIAGEQQRVFTSITNAVENANGLNKPTGNTVNDYAVVLVGNVHQYNTTSNAAIGGNYRYTVTTIDLDHDNEPDYSLMFRDDGRNPLHPVKWDFLNIVGLGMAQKATGGTGSYNLGIPQPIGWFEVTNTALFRVTQFEYDRTNRVAAPLILQGGVIEQWVSGQSSGVNNQTTYFHVGGNVWFKEFHRGCHQDSELKSKHPPVSVTGGDYDEFYLTGLYKAVETYDDNAECYINGGRFGTLAGTGLEGIGHATNHTNGNITWQIQNADIREFYGGGINAASPMQGSITSVIDGGYIEQFCGGPKFGDMRNGKTVTTTATNCTFGTYFGAGYGGNSYSRQAPFNFNSNVTNINWNRWIKGEINNENSDTRFNGYQLDYKNESYNRGIFEGVSVEFNYQFLPLSNNTLNVARLFIEYVKFSLATTRNVTSKLTGCTVTGNFYGGGSLGKVDGPVTSTLTDCSVNGNVFGAGYSATLPTVEADSIGFRVEPYYYSALGTYRKGVKGATTTYTWEHRDVVNSTETAIDKTNHILYTTEDLTTLGTVTGLVTLNIDGTTSVNGSVYGGGEMSGVGGSVVVNMNGGTVQENLYGGGALASTNTGNVTAGYGTDSETIPSTATNTTTVNLHGGKIVGMAFGGGLGSKPTLTNPDAENIPAYVYGDVVVKLNENTGDDCKLLRLYGCNNYNGTPKGSVLVHVYKTAGFDDTHKKQSTTDESDNVIPLKDNSSYDVTAVYGGGNEAAYVPVDDASEAHVIIDGCDATSIQYVYGGGNAASVPATHVEVNGCYEIGSLFGGGNGLDALSDGSPNPGANVGYYADGTTEYGQGKTFAELLGGTIHYAFGGSNTKGNIRVGATMRLDEAGDCPLEVEEVYGAGNKADQDGAAQIQLGCVSYLKEIYGGAREADLGGNVVLSITSGRFDRVFGGNNVDGDLTGTITVNIEETGCHPIIIRQLYGGGNLAAYSAPAGAAGPTLNVRSFTSIGDIYGGGYGASAIVTGDTYINIDECLGNNHSSEVSETTAHTGKNIDIVVGEDGSGTPVTESVFQPAHTVGAIGSINNVYGGGNAAKVNGNTYVKIGTKMGESIVFVTPETATETERTKTVLGVDIKNNVFGGGNQADVTGKTNVVVGKDN